MIIFKWFFITSKIVNLGIISCFFRSKIVTQADLLERVAKYYVFYGAQTQTQTRSLLRSSRAKASEACGSVACCRFLPG